VASKGVTGALLGSVANTEFRDWRFEVRPTVAPLSRVFAYEWQGKDLHGRECVRVAGKGTYRRAFLHFGAAAVAKGYPTPGVLEKEAASC